MRIFSPVVRTVGTLTETVRDLGRMREVATVLARHGLGLLVANIDIPGFRGPRSGRFESTPERAVAAVQELGPTFIKLGQVLSTRPDVIPTAYVDAFQRLQDDVDSVPFDVVDRVLARELGPGWRDGFLRVDQAPLATASIAQVHRAALLDGTEVVLKVQRPEAHPRVRADLSILRFIVKRLVAEFPEAAFFDPQGILEQFQRSIMAELDFEAEAEHARLFRRHFEGDPSVVIPRIHRDLSTSRVLCMDFVDGVKVRDAREAGCDMALVGRRYLHIAYTMVFDHGFFHGDLHPGNVLVLPGERIGLLDFGMVGRLTREMRDQVVLLIFALQRGDYRSIARIYFDIGIKEGRVDYGAFERDVIEVMERNWSGVSIRDMRIGRYLNDIARGAVRHRVRAPPDFTMFFKALLTTEGLARMLIPELDPVAEALPWVQRLVQERFSARRLREDLFYDVLTVSTLLRRLPASASQLLDDLDHQRIQLVSVGRESPELRRDRERRRHGLELAILAAAALLAASLALWAPGPRVLSMPLPALLLYGLALPLVGIAILGALRGRRR